MIITYFRSSSYNNWSFCQAQYYYTYVLGLRPDDQNGWRIPKPQFKADQGSVTHKVLELLASKKLAMQNGDVCFTNDELGKSWRVEEFDVEDAIEEAWTYYTQTKPSPWDWTPTEYRKIRRWVYAAMEFSGGMFNPLNRDILWPEAYFDFVIDKPWASYEFEFGGKIIQGQLGLKGTMDLTARVDGFPDTIELIDWKTGSRKDWATDTPKTWKKLRDDPQMRLYHYALSRICPAAKHIIVTIVWIRDGGPFSLDFGPGDLEETENMILERFEEIKQCELPERIKGNRQVNDRDYKCRLMCAFGMNRWKNTGKLVCDHLYRELVQIGAKGVVEKYGEQSVFSSYREGGGVSDREAINRGKDQA